MRRESELGVGAIEFCLSKELQGAICYTDFMYSLSKKRIWKKARQWDSHSLKSKSVNIVGICIVDTTEVQI